MVTGVKHYSTIYSLLLRNFSAHLLTEQFVKQALTGHHTTPHYMVTAEVYWVVLAMQ